MNVGSIKISERHELLICLVVTTILALAIRFVLMPFESEDVRVFIVWLMNIKEHGVSYVLTQTGALFLYNPPFIYLLSIGSLLPSWIPDVVIVKMISIPFEIMTAYLSAQIIKKLGHGDKAALLGYALVLLAPTVLLNGAVWGQCDAIFTSFIVLSIFFLCEEKPLWSMIAFGLSLSFKLQSMVFAPAILCFFLIGKIRIRDIALIPIAYIAMLIPSVIAGRDIVSLLTIYGGQAETYRSITINAPNLYVWFQMAIV